MFSYNNDLAIGNLGFSNHRKSNPRYKEIDRDFLGLSNSSLSYCTTTNLKFKKCLSPRCLTHEDAQQLITVLILMYYSVKLTI